MNGCRIGYGYDVHALAVGKKLILGGVCVSEQFGSIAHSDGDALLHAICDALLGAAALGDIGHHFPDTDPAFKAISSILLLRETKRLILEAGFTILNIDATVLLEKPRIAPFILSMRANIAEALNLTVDRVSIKATTSEKLGFIGEERGVASHAIALLEKEC
jgi:2-C-methyl-D-erythritol 2,4-cyclodiphosphate synthase